MSTTHTNPTINVLNQVSRKASKVLMRDFFELENIQSSPKGPYNYASKSIDIVQDIIYKELIKAYPDYSIMLDEDKYINKAASEYRFIINPLDGYHNLARCNPFFAFSITLEKINKDKYEPIVCLINSAFLGLTYYASKGQGSWLEKIERGLSTAYRIRVSSNNAQKGALIALNQLNIEDADNRLLTKRIQEISGDFRILGSELMTGAYIASGKFDAALFQKPAYNNLSAIRLLINEAGGIIFNIKNGVSDAYVSCSAAQYKELFKHFNG
jgi:myo-inositol-1(or 4)-monophosphatase